MTCAHRIAFRWFPEGADEDGVPVRGVLLHLQETGEDESQRRPDVRPPGLAREECRDRGGNEGRRK